MKICVKTFRNKKGSAYPLAVAVTLSLLIIFAGISEYFRLQLIAQGVRNAFQDAVIATISDNYDEVFHGTREGYSGGYKSANGSFYQALDYGDVYGRLDTNLGLYEVDEMHVKYTSDWKTEFKVSNLIIGIQNAPYASQDMPGSRFVVESSVLIEVPVSFAGKLLPSMMIRVKCSAGFTPKF